MSESPALTRVTDAYRAYRAAADQRAPAILDARAAGHTQREIAQAADITERSVRDIIKRAEAPGSSN